MNTTTTENYIRYESLVSYWSYRRYLSLNQDTIIASLTQLTRSSLTFNLLKTCFVEACGQKICEKFK
ncbi:hypothetical protein RIR_jg20222.t1 [Rhizophagus irregularis DAOM 181602=DAOM 197198]|uniref:Uncharacterized protein n=1 Tax=Rhizophagus irregularis TaxID=588596 RepID=A0A2N1MQJ3_9GLOM|nr:hypothetical protein RhiirC2_122467 [Rhizophagus irregularis]GET63169.1 hypothetical protein RIR_jg20222.t1 [Rhizophagus irregularis DAOM 181602=DAOM 197198]